MSFPRVQFSVIFSGGACACPRTPYIIRAFGADSTLVSAVTVVLNVQLTAQKSCPLQKCVPKKLEPSPLSIRMLYRENPYQRNFKTIISLE